MGVCLCRERVIVYGGSVWIMSGGRDGCFCVCVCVCLCVCVCVCRDWGMFGGRGNLSMSREQCGV